MPYDTLGCQSGFGSGILPESVIYNLVDLDDGPRGLRFPSYTQTYSEYTVVKEKTTTSSSGFVFAIELYFQRSSRDYIFLVIIPSILFVYISFEQFFFNSGSGERVTFGTSVLLVLVAQSIVTSDMLPRCKERIWMNDFSFSCQFFVLAGVFEALILYCLKVKRLPMKSVSKHMEAFIHDSSVHHDHDSNASNANKESTSVHHDRDSNASNANKEYTSVHHDHDSNASNAKKESTSTNYMAQEMVSRRIRMLSIMKSLVSKQ